MIATLPGSTADRSTSACCTAAAATPSGPASTNRGSSPSWRTEEGGVRSGAASASTLVARAMFGPGSR